MEEKSDSSKLYQYGPAWNAHMKLALIYLQIFIPACCYANGILTDLEKAYDFTYSFDCPEIVVVNEVFACNLTVNGGERIVSTVQWEGNPPKKLSRTRVSHKSGSKISIMYPSESY
ncbi:hypothetical protein ACTXT7_015019 [Hymenolepis weldensis]